MFYPGNAGSRACRADRTVLERGDLGYTCLSRYLV